MFNILDKPYRDEIKAFGSYWCGPAKYENWKRVLVAKFPKSPADGDGQSVEVFCTPAPARFYELVVAREPDGVGKIREGFVVSFGSGQWDLARVLADTISEGMLGFSPIDSEKGN